MTAESPPALPQNIEAEQAVLGAVLLNQNTLDRLGFLLPDHFFDPVHARIFAACRKRYEAGEHVSAVVMRSIIGSDPGLQELGGPDYLGRLAAAVVAVSAAPDYARAIVELYSRREVITAAENAVTAATAMDADSGAEEAIERLERDLDTIRGRTQLKRATAGAQIAMTDAVDRMLEAREKGPGTPTGIADLDEHMGGLYPGDLTIIAGRPGMGKSLVATAIARRIAERRRHVIVSSLEMPETDIANRWISERLRTRGQGIAYRDMRRGRLDDDQTRTIIETALALSELPVDFIGMHVRRLSHIAAEVRRITRKARANGDEVGAFVLDYIGLVDLGDDRLTENQKITRITGALKALAGELKIPVIALSQLSRGVETRENKRPFLSDLRDSGSIEQDADNVIFCYRDEYYLERARPTEDDERFPEWAVRVERTRGKLELISAKQRNGAVGTVTVGCDPAFNRIYDLSPDRHARGPQVPQEEIAF